MSGTEQKNTAFDHPASDSVKGHKRKTPNRRSHEACTWLPESNCDILLRERLLILDSGQRLPHQNIVTTLLKCPNRSKKMADTSFNSCAPVQISDDDIFTAMSEISGYLDITSSDFKELYLKAYEHALSRLTRTVKVKEVMTTRVITAKIDSSLENVAGLMAENHISGLPVVDEKGKPLGIISERDFLEVMVGKKSAGLMEIIVQCLGGRNCLMAPIRVKSAKDLMTKPVIIVGGDESVDDVSNLFASKGINRAPVVDEEGRMIGIVSRGDLMRAFVTGGQE